MVLPLSVSQLFMTNCQVLNSPRTCRFFTHFNLSDKVPKDPVKFLLRKCSKHWCQLYSGHCWYKCSISQSQILHWYHWCLPINAMMGWDGWYPCGVRFRTFQKLTGLLEKNHMNNYMLRMAKYAIWQLLSRTHYMSPVRAWKWKWSNGVEKSESDLFWCISMTNNEIMQKNQWKGPNFQI